MSYQSWLQLKLMAIKPEQVQPEEGVEQEFFSRTSAKIARQAFKTIRAIPIVDKLTLPVTKFLFPQTSLILDFEQDQVDFIEAHHPAKAIQPVYYGLLFQELFKTIGSLGVAAKDTAKNVCGGIKFSSKVAGLHILGAAYRASYIEAETLNKYSNRFSLDEVTKMGWSSVNDFQEDIPWMKFKDTISKKLVRSQKAYIVTNVLSALVTSALALQTYGGFKELLGAALFIPIALTYFIDSIIYTNSMLKAMEKQPMALPKLHADKTKRLAHGIIHYGFGGVPWAAMTDELWNAERYGKTKHKYIIEGYTMGKRNFEHMGLAVGGGKFEWIREVLGREKDLQTLLEKMPADDRDRLLATLAYLPKNDSSVEVARKVVYRYLDSPNNRKMGPIERFLGHFTQMHEKSDGRELTEEVLLTTVHDMILQEMTGELSALLSKIKDPELKKLLEKNIEQKQLAKWALFFGGNNTKNPRQFLRENILEKIEKDKVDRPELEKLLKELKKLFEKVTIEKPKTDKKNPAADKNIKYEKSNVSEKLWNINKVIQLRLPSIILGTDLKALNGGAEFIGFLKEILMKNDKVHGKGLTEEEFATFLSFLNEGVVERYEIEKIFGQAIEVLPVEVSSLFESPRTGLELTFVRDAEIKINLIKDTQKREQLLKVWREALENGATKQLAERQKTILTKWLREAGQSKDAYDALVLPLEKCQSIAEEIISSAKKLNRINIVAANSKALLYGSSKFEGNEEKYLSALQDEFELSAEDAQIILSTLQNKNQEIIKKSLAVGNYWQRDLQPGQGDLFKADIEEIMAAVEFFDGPEKDSPEGIDTNFGEWIQVKWEDYLAQARAYLKNTSTSSVPAIASVLNKFFILSGNINRIVERKIVLKYLNQDKKLLAQLQVNENDQNEYIELKADFEKILDSLPIDTASRENLRAYAKNNVVARLLSADTINEKILDVLDKKVKAEIGQPNFMMPSLNYVLKVLEHYWYMAEKGEKITLTEDVLNFLQNAEVDWKSKYSYNRLEKFWIRHKLVAYSNKPKEGASRLTNFAGNLRLFFYNSGGLYDDYVASRMSKFAARAIAKKMLTAEEIVTKMQQNFSGHSAEQANYLVWEQWEKETKAYLQEAIRGELQEILKDKVSKQLKKNVGRLDFYVEDMTNKAMEHFMEGRQKHLCMTEGLIQRVADNSYADTKMLQALQSDDFNLLQSEWNYRDYQDINQKLKTAAAQVNKTPKLANLLDIIFQKAMEKEGRFHGFLYAGNEIENIAIDVLLNGKDLMYELPYQMDAEKTVQLVDVISREDIFKNAKVNSLDYRFVDPQFLLAQLDNKLKAANKQLDAKEAELKEKNKVLQEKYKKTLSEEDHQNKITIEESFKKELAEVKEKINDLKKAQTELQDQIREKGSDYRLISAEERAELEKAIRAYIQAKSAKQSSQVLLELTLQNFVHKDNLGVDFNPEMMYTTKNQILKYFEDNQPDKTSLTGLADTLQKAQATKGFDAINNFWTRFGGGTKALFDAKVKQLTSELKAGKLQRPLESGQLSLEEVEEIKDIQQNFESMFFLEMRIEGKTYHGTKGSETDATMANAEHGRQMGTLTRQMLLWKYTLEHLGEDRYHLPNEIAHEIENLLEMIRMRDLTDPEKHTRDIMKERGLNYKEIYKNIINGLTTGKSSHQIVAELWKQFDLREEDIKNGSLELSGKFTLDKIKEEIEHITSEVAIRLYCGKAHGVYMLLREMRNQAYDPDHPAPKQDNEYYAEAKALFELYQQGQFTKDGQLDLEAALVAYLENQTIRGAGWQHLNFREKQEIIKELKITNGMDQHDQNILKQVAEQTDPEQKKKMQKLLPEYLFLTAYIQDEKGNYFWTKGPAEASVALERSRAVLERLTTFLPHIKTIAGDLGKQLRTQWCFDRGRTGTEIAVWMNSHMGAKLKRQYLPPNQSEVGQDWAYGSFFEKVGQEIDANAEKYQKIITQHYTVDTQNMVWNTVDHLGAELREALWAKECQIDIGSAILEQVETKTKKAGEWSHLTETEKTAVVQIIKSGDLSTQAQQITVQKDQIYAQIDQLLSVIYPDPARFPAQQKSEERELLYKHFVNGLEAGKPTEQIVAEALRLLQPGQSCEEISLDQELREMAGRGEESVRGKCVEYFGELVNDVKRKTQCKSTEEDLTRLHRYFTHMAVHAKNLWLIQQNNASPKEQINVNKMYQDGPTGQVYTVLYKLKNQLRDNYNVLLAAEVFHDIGKIAAEVNHSQGSALIYEQYRRDKFAELADTAFYKDVLSQLTEQEKEIVGLLVKYHDIGAINIDSNFGVLEKLKKELQAKDIEIDKFLEDLNFIVAMDRASVVEQKSTEGFLSFFDYKTFHDALDLAKSGEPYIKNIEDVGDFIGRQLVMVSSNKRQLYNDLNPQIREFLMNELSAREQAALVEKLNGLVARIENTNYINGHFLLFGKFGKQAIPPEYSFGQLLNEWKNSLNIPPEYIKNFSLIKLVTTLLFDQEKKGIESVGGVSKLLATDQRDCVFNVTPEEAAQLLHEILQNQPVENKIIKIQPKAENGQRVLEEMAHWEKMRQGIMVNSLKVKEQLTHIGSQIAVNYYSDQMQQVGDNLAKLIVPENVPEEKNNYQEAARQIYQNCLQSGHNLKNKASFSDFLNEKKYKKSNAEILRLSSLINKDRDNKPYDEFFDQAAYYDFNDRLGVIENEIYMILQGVQTAEHKEDWEITQDEFNSFLLTRSDAFPVGCYNMQNYHAYLELFEHTVFLEYERPELEWGPLRKVTEFFTKQKVEDLQLGPDGKVKVVYAENKLNDFMRNKMKIRALNRTKFDNAQSSSVGVVDYWLNKWLNIYKGTGSFAKVLGTVMVLLSGAQFLPAVSPIFAGFPPLAAFFPVLVLVSYWLRRRQYNATPFFWQLTGADREKAKSWEINRLAWTFGIATAYGLPTAILAAFGFATWFTIPLLAVGYLAYYWHKRQTEEADPFFFREYNKQKPVKLAQTGANYRTVENRLVAHTNRESSLEDSTLKEKMLRQSFKARFLYKKNQRNPEDTYWHTKIGQFDMRWIPSSARTIQKYVFDFLEYRQKKTMLDWSFTVNMFLYPFSPFLAMGMRLIMPTYLLFNTQSLHFFTDSVKLFELTHLQLFVGINMLNYMLMRRNTINRRRVIGRSIEEAKIPFWVELMHIYRMGRETLRKAKGIFSIDMGFDEFIATTATVAKMRSDEADEYKKWRDKLPFYNMLAGTDPNMHDLGYIKTSLVMTVIETTYIVSLMASTGFYGLLSAATLLYWEGHNLLPAFKAVVAMKKGASRKASSEPDAEYKKLKRKLKLYTAIRSALVASLVLAFHFGPTGTILQNLLKKAPTADGISESIDQAQKLLKPARQLITGSGEEQKKFVAPEKMSDEDLDQIVETEEAKVQAKAEINKEKQEEKKLKEQKKDKARDKSLDKARDKTLDKARDKQKTIKVNKKVPIKIKEPAKERTVEKTKVEPQQYIPKKNTGDVLPE